MTVGVTGSTGYVGRHVLQALRRHGHDVREFRRIPSGRQSVAFTLGQDVARAAFDGVDALVHAAYDRRPATWDDVNKINVRGSVRLFEAARAAGTKIVFVSSAAAFEGTRSNYGRAKLAVEHETLARGATVVRPGLVFGLPLDGLFGSLMRLAALPVVPLAGGHQRFHTCHVADLAEALVEMCARSAPTHPVAAAHPAPLAFAEILRILARAQGRSPWLVRVPSWSVYAGLRLAETLHLGSGLRSDSFVGLMHRNPAYACSYDYATAFRPLTVETVLQ